MKKKNSRPEDKRLKAFNTFTDAIEFMTAKTRIMMIECAGRFRYPTVLLYNYQVVQKILFRIRQ